MFPNYSSSAQLHAGERDAQEQKAKKATKKQVSQERKEARKTGLLIPRPSAASPIKPGFSIPGVAGKKLKRKKTIRIRKNSMIRGIRITDAASKQKVKEILAAEEAMREWGINDDEDQPTTMEVKMKLGSGSGGVKKKKRAEKKAKKAASKPAGMVVD